MQEMFGSAYKFNGDISSWNTSQVTTMYYMFGDANVFNSDLSSWDVSSVRNMYNVFVSIQI